MPYDAFGKFTASQTDITTDTLGFGEIGGVGQLIYSLFRFKKYTVSYTDNGDILAYPSCHSEGELDFHNSEDLIGADLLASLYNLALKINDFSEEKSFVELIIEWCESVAYPYFIDEINALLLDKEFDFEQCSFLLEKDGVFSINDFMRDLERLYQVTSFAFALEQMEKGFDDACFDLANDGRYFSGVPFLEKYKADMPEYSDDWKTNSHISPLDLLLEMQADSKNAKPIHINTKEEGFARVPYDDFEELRDKLIDMIPDFRMRLKVNRKRNRVVLAADIHSVFDIAWHTLARKICEDPMPRLKQKMSELDRDERPVVLTCPICGRAFVRKGKANRKTYCGNPECNKRRLAQNTRNCRKRKKVAEMQSEGKKAAE